MRQVASSCQRTQSCTCSLLLVAPVMWLAKHSSLLVVWPRRWDQTGRFHPISSSRTSRFSCNRSVKVLRLSHGPCGRKAEGDSGPAREEDATGRGSPKATSAGFRTPRISKRSRRRMGSRGKRAGRSIAKRGALPALHRSSALDAQ